MAGSGGSSGDFGLTIDNLRAVELVTADGRFVRASETEEPELFWGIRGAGWNFGIVTAFEFGLQPFGPDLNRGVRIYPASAAREAWQVFEDYAATAPETVSMIYGISHDEVDTGDARRRRLVQPQRSRGHRRARHGRPASRPGADVRSATRSQSYLEAQTAHDLSLGWGGRSFIKGLYANVRPARGARRARRGRRRRTRRWLLLHHRPGRRDRPGR